MLSVTLPREQDYDGSVELADYPTSYPMPLMKKHVSFCIYPPTKNADALPEEYGVAYDWPARDFCLEESLRHHWPIIKVILKEEYLDLTDDDLLYVQGLENEFIIHLERKTGHPRKEFIKVIREKGAVSTS